jgi:hypothetical protein
MGMDRYIPALFDELEKIAISKKLSPFMQIRSETRPIRVATMLAKEKQDSGDRDVEDSKSLEVEGGQGIQDGGVPG